VSEANSEPGHDLVTACDIAVVTTTGTITISSTDSAFLVRSASPATLGRTLAAIGRDRPVVFDELMAAPLVLRHKDVSAALRNPATFSTAFYGVGPMAGSMIAQNGPEHGRLRRVQNRFFSPAASARYTERVVPVARREFGVLAGRPRAELVEDVMARYPMAVFLELLGIPDELGDQGLAWVRTIVKWLGSPMNAELVAPGEQAYAALSEYTATLIERDRADPGDNLLGEIIRAHLGEDEFSVDECTSAVVSLLLGGFETTIQMLSGTIAALLCNPDALAAVRADRTLVDAAINEAFRWANPSAGLYRLVTRETEIAGTAVAAGNMVYLCIAAAHFDADAHPSPERFDLGRDASHLGFGLGPHYCAGAPLAKIEVGAALNALLDVAPGLRLDPERPPEFHYGARDFVQHGTEAMHVLL
jgi:cytochrome P450